MSGALAKENGKSLPSSAFAQGPLWMFHGLWDGSEVIIAILILVSSAVCVQ